MKDHGARVHTQHRSRLNHPKSTKNLTHVCVCAGSLYTLEAKLGLWARKGSMTLCHRESSELCPPSDTQTSEREKERERESDADGGICRERSEKIQAARLISFLFFRRSNQSFSGFSDWLLPHSLSPVLVHSEDSCFWCLYRHRSCPKDRDQRMLIEPCLLGRTHFTAVDNPQNRTDCFKDSHRRERR